MEEETEVVEGELVVHEPAQEIAPRGGLFNTNDPELVVEKATKTADVLMDVVRNKGLSTMIQGREYLNVEAWTTLGAMLGVTARTEWTKPLLDPDGVTYGYEAAVEVINANGQVIARSEAQCTRGERTWANRDDYALRSMAQTRAMGKALRMPLGFIAVLAGYEATPMEEMPAPQNVVARTGNTGNQAPRGNAISAAVLKKKLATRTEPQWGEQAVVEAANRQWNAAYTSIDELTAEQRKMVYMAVPDE